MALQWIRGWYSLPDWQWKQKQYPKASAAWIHGSEYLLPAKYWIRKPGFGPANRATHWWQKCIGCFEGWYHNESHVHLKNPTSGWRLLRDRCHQSNQPQTHLVWPTFHHSAHSCEASWLVSNRPALQPFAFRKLKWDEMDHHGYRFRWYMEHIHPADRSSTLPSVFWPGHAIQGTTCYALKVLPFQYQE